MLDEYRKLGFAETIQKTRFCHTPINNEPCGTCNPCKSVLEEGLGFRLTGQAINRYNVEMKFGKYRVYRYIKAVRLRSKRRRIKDIKEF